MAIITLQFQFPINVSAQIGDVVYAVQPTTPGTTPAADLEEAGITTNKNMVPYDTKSPFITSGIRIGTPALTTRGMGTDEMILIGELIDNVLLNIDNETTIHQVSSKVSSLCKKFPLYPLLK